MSFSARLFRTKPASPQAFCDSGLNRCLGAFDLTFLGIGAIIGTGIFVLTGIGAAVYSGPAVILSFVLAGLASGFAALAYAELASSVGGSGSAYGYSYAAFGELVAWLVGWDLILEYAVSVAAVANGWSGYFNNALTAIGLGLPTALTKAPVAGGLINLPASLIILLLMGLLIIGVRESARVNVAMVFVKLLTIAVFIAVAAFHVHPENWSPFVPFGWFEHGADGRPIGVLAGASIVFFAYVGFDAVSTAVEEARRPQRDVPIGIIASLVVCTVVYIVVSGLLTGIVPYTELNVSSPVAYSLQLLGMNWASALVATGVITGLTTVMLVLYYALTRIIFAMARDGLITPKIGRVNPKNANADPHHRDLRRIDFHRGGTGAAGRTGGAGQYRHARGLCAGLPGRDRAAHAPAGFASAFQKPVGHYLAGVGDYFLRRADGVLARDHLVPLPAVDGRRFGAVLRLFLPPFPFEFRRPLIGRKGGDSLNALTQIRQQPLTGSFDHIEHLLKALRAAVIRIGHIMAAKIRRERHQ